MQHDRILKKLNSDLLTPSPGYGGGSAGKKLLPRGGGGGGGGADLRAKICYHVAAFEIPFNLICSMNMF